MRRKDKRWRTKVNKIILEFDDKEEALDAMNGTKYLCQIEEIWDECFRPCFKHGYEPRIEAMIEECGRDNAHDLIEAIAEIYLEVVKE